MHEGGHVVGAACAQWRTHYATMGYILPHYCPKQCRIFAVSCRYYAH